MSTSETIVAWVLLSYARFARNARSVKLKGIIGKTARCVVHACFMTLFRHYISQITTCTLRKSLTKSCFVHGQPNSLSKAWTRQRELRTRLRFGFVRVAPVLGAPASPISCPATSFHLVSSPSSGLANKGSLTHRQKESSDEAWSHSFTRDLPQRHTGLNLMTVMSHFAMNLVTDFVKGAKSTSSSFWLDQHGGVFSSILVWHNCPAVHRGSKHTCA